LVLFKIKSHIGVVKYGTVLSNKKTIQGMIWF